MVLKGTLYLIKIDRRKGTRELLPVWHPHIQSESPHSQTLPGKVIEIYVLWLAFMTLGGVTSIFYLYQPVWSTDSCPHIGEVQHAVPEEPVVRLIREPATALVKNLHQQNICPVPVYFLGSHGEINCVTWSLVRPREVCCPAGQQLGDLHNSLLIRLVTSKAAHLDTRQSVYLRGRG